MIRIIENKCELEIYYDNNDERQTVLNLLTTYDNNENPIHVWHDDGNPIRTFVGYKDYLKYHLPSAETIDYDGIEISDININPKILSGIELWDFQIIAVRKALIHKRGVILSPVGSGKTIMAMAIMKYHDLPSIIVVPTTYLEDQFYYRMKQFGFDVGRLNDINKKKYIVGVFKSVNIMLDKIDKSYYKCLIMDEYHHGQATTWRNIYYHFMDLEYVLGFTGTLYRDPESNYKNIRSGNIQDFITLGMSKLIVDIPYSLLINKGILAEPIILINSINSGNAKYYKNWQMVFKRGIVNNKARNKLIIDHIIKFVNSGKTVIVLSSVLKHIFNIADKLPDDVKNVARICKGDRIGYYWNGINWSRRKIDINYVRDRVRDRKIKIILATTVFNEGIDFPEIDVVILAFAGKAFTRVLQMIGRGMRRSGNKDKVYIVDFYDNTHPYLINQSKKRIKYYTDILNANVMFI